jgi:hypothetical protein
MAPIKTDSFAARMVGAARLRPEVYRRILLEPSADQQALIVVVLSSFCAGFGILEQVGLEGVLIGTLLLVVLWYFLAWFVCWIGTRFFKEPEMTVPDRKALLRVLGFTNVPGFFRLTPFFLGMAPVIYFVVLVWILAATVLAVRLAFNYEKVWRAVAVTLLGWTAQFLTMQALFVMGGK